MGLLVIDIWDKIEEVGILFANLLEDCPPERKYLVVDTECIEGRNLAKWFHEHL